MSKVKIPVGLKGKELFKYLVDNKAYLVDAKKSDIKIADALSVMPWRTQEHTEAEKGKFLYENDENAGVLKRTIIANTYNWLDSHDDVHLNGIFAKSITEKGAKAPHLHDHLFELGAKVGQPIGFSERDISWRALGQSKTGMTQALFMESKVLKSYNAGIYDEYLNDQIDQHSVRMRYINLALAVNDSENYPVEYKVWQDTIARLGNRAQAEAQGYYWAVSEAALIEVSAVLLGANELTPTLGNKEQSLDDAETKEKVEPRKALDLTRAVRGFEKQLLTKTISK